MDLVKFKTRVFSLCVLPMIIGVAVAVTSWGGDCGLVQASDSGLAHPGVKDICSLIKTASEENDLTPDGNRELMEAVSRLGTTEDRLAAFRGVEAELFSRTLISTNYYETAFHCYHFRKSLDVLAATVWATTSNECFIVEMWERTQRWFETEAKKCDNERTGLIEEMKRLQVKKLELMKKLALVRLADFTESEREDLKAYEREKGKFPALRERYLAVNDLASVCRSWTKTSHVRYLACQMLFDMEKAGWKERSRNFAQKVRVLTEWMPENDTSWQDGNIRQYGRRQKWQWAIPPPNKHPPMPNVMISIN